MVREVAHFLAELSGSPIAVICSQTGQKILKTFSNAKLSGFF